MPRGRSCTWADRLPIGGERNLPSRMSSMIYTVAHVDRRPALGASWTEMPWQDVPYLEIAHYREESSPHRPRVQVRLLYEAGGLWGMFRVTDRYIRCVHTGFQTPVCRDSCVECFLQPKTGGGYFNFEFNCGGTMLAYYITDPTRVDAAFAAYTPLKPTDGRHVGIRPSLPEVIDPEITAPVTWTLAFHIPFSLLETYAGPLTVAPGTTWHANFYKCADDSSHPHWGAWSPVDELNFHLPRCFGEIRFGRP